MTPKVRIGCRYERPYFVERTTTTFRALRPAITDFEARLQASLLNRQPPSFFGRLKEIFNGA